MSGQNEYIHLDLSAWLGSMPEATWKPNGAPGMVKVLCPYCGGVHLHREPGPHRIVRLAWCCDRWYRLAESPGPGIDPAAPDATAGNLAHHFLQETPQTGGNVRNAGFRGSQKNGPRGGG